MLFACPLPPVNYLLLLPTDFWLLSTVEADYLALFLAMPYCVVCTYISHSHSDSCCPPLCIIIMLLLRHNYRYTTVTYCSNLRHKSGKMVKSLSGILGPLTYCYRYRINCYTLSSHLIQFNRTHKCLPPASNYYVLILLFAWLLVVRANEVDTISNIEWHQVCPIQSD